MKEGKWRDEKRKKGRKEKRLSSCTNLIH